LTASPTPNADPFAWSLDLILLITVLACGIGALTLYYVEQQFIVATGESLALGAGEVADKVDRLLAERYGDVQMMARAFSMQRFSPEDLTAYLVWMRETYPVYAWIGVTDREGRIVAATDPLTLGLDLSPSRWFRETREGTSVSVGDVGTYEATGGSEAVAFTAPIRGPGGVFLGAVSTRVAIPPIEDVITGTLRTFHERRDAFRHFEYQILSADGRAFIDSDLLHKGNVNLHRLGVLSALASRTMTSGFVQEPHLRRHVPVITGYAQTHGSWHYKGMHWAVLLRVDEADVLTPIRSILWRIAGAGAAVVLPLIVTLTWSSFRLRRQWRMAQFEAQRATMSQERLQATEERASLIVETALDAVISMNAKGMVMSWNTRAEETFGWPLLAAVGQPLASLIIPPRLRRAHEQGLQRFLMTGESTVIGHRIEVTALHRDGREFPAELSIAVAGEGERKIFNAFVRDISERIRTERRLAAQYAATKVLAGEQDLDAALSRILRAVCESLDWHHGAIWHVDREVQVLRFGWMWHAPSLEAREFESYSRVTIFHKGIGLPGRVWETGEPAWIPDVTHDPNFPRAAVAARAGLRGGFAFPIRLRDEVLGVLEFFSHAKADPDRDLLLMVGAIGSQIGQYIERKRAEADLLRARDAAEAASVAKSQFLTNMSHELRTPMNGILGMISLAQTTELTAEQEDLLSTAQSSAETLLGVMNDILDLSRMDAGELTICPAAFSLAGCLEETLAAHRPVSAAKGLELTLLTEPSVPADVIGDRSRLQQILTNLVGNAIKFTPSGQVEVKVEVERAAGNNERGAMCDDQENEKSSGSSVQRLSFIVLHFSVRDTGIGIPLDKQDMIFQAFTQGDGSLTRKFGGTGLGLAIAKRLTDMMGGRMWVESAVGTGSTFHFTVSLESRAPSIRAALQISDLTLTEDCMNESLPSKPTRPLSVPPEAGLDLEAALARLEGDIELLQAIAQQVLDNVPRLLHDVRDAVAGGDAKALTTAAHKLKGSVNELAARAAAEAAQRLEAIGRLGTLDHAPQALAALDQAMGRLTPALEDIVKRPRN
jgi:PAS domain S-box-containing protein